MAFDRFARGVALATGLVLSGCYSPHPGFGADNVERIKDTNGVPTYSAFGHLAYGENPERDVAKFLKAACPTGNPVLLTGQALDLKGTNINREDVAEMSWIIAFTCDQPIAIPPG